MPTITTNDDVELYYEIQGDGKPVLFVTGWSCSLNFFEKNIPVLAEDYQVIAVDYRGHGESENPGHGYRISRFAMDMREVLEQLDVTDVTAVGWSMGAAVLWSYLELFGSDRISKLVSIDQSPKQYIGPDWDWGQNSCYDVESFIRLVKDIEHAEREVSEGLVDVCLNHEPTEEETSFLADEIMKCSKTAKIEIMRDHTNLDWRDLLPEIDIPTLVLVGRESQVFPWEGSAYVGEQIPNAETVFFEDEGHMLFWDNPEKFNEELQSFIG